MKKMVLAVILLCWAGCLGIAQAEKTYHVSVNQFVEHPALDAVLKGLQDGLNEQGLTVEYKIHNAQANMGTATQIAKQMIGEKPDLLIAIATPSAQASAQAVSRAPDRLKRPLIFSAVTDPVAAGLVKDLQSPGGDITGVSDQLPIKEHMGMVLAFLPDLKRLGVLYNGGEANSKATIAVIRELGGTMGFEVVEATASRTADVFQAAQSLAGRVDAVFIPTDNTIIAALESVIKVGIDRRMPVFAADVDSVKRGAVAAMGFDYYKHGVQTGIMAARVLRGEKPADIPVEFQEELELHINMKFADKMGVVPPEEQLKKANQVYR